MAEKNPNTKSGRPRKAQSMLRTNIVQTKLTTMEYEKVKKRAEKAGMSVYEYVKEAVLSERRKPSPRLTSEIWALAKTQIELTNKVLQTATILAEKFHREDLIKYIEDIKENKNSLIEKLKT